MTKKEKKLQRDIQKALNDFPEIIRKQKENFKEKQRIQKRFEPLVKELLKKLKARDTKPS